MTAPDVLLEGRHLSKRFGQVTALADVSLTLHRNEVLCLLGDNGAGKSTLIKILSGYHTPDGGNILVDGVERTFHSPRDAIDQGISTVYQDLALMPLMSVTRNFFLGNEPTVGFGPFRKFDKRRARHLVRDAIADIGITVRNPDQPVGTLSGGEKQTLAIARAEFFGARVLILDEPTSALGVKEAGEVLRHIRGARNRGLGVIFITHNVTHALPVGDRYLVLNHGAAVGTYRQGEIAATDLLALMAGLKNLEDSAKYFLT